MDLSVGFSSFLGVAFLCIEGLMLWHCLSLSLKLLNLSSRCLPVSSRISPWQYPKSCIYWPVPLCPAFYRSSRDPSSGPVLAGLMSPWHKLESFWKKESQLKTTLPVDCSVGKSEVCFLDWPWMWGIQLTVGDDPWLYKKPRWASHEKQAIKQHSSMVSCGGCEYNWPA